MKNNFKFYTEIEVRISDINYGGHLSNDRYLTLFHDARIRYLNQFNVSELNLGDNIGVIMAESFVKYQAEAFLGDKLKIGVRVTQMQAIKFFMEYEIIRITDNKTIGSGYTKLAGYSYDKKRVSKLPSTFVKKIEQYETLLAKK